MKLLKPATIAISVLLLAAACNRLSTHSRSAVERAINDHLSENRHLKSGSFHTKVESVAFKGDTAAAVVRFESTESSALFVEVKYGLRLENGKWQVVSSAPMSGQGGDSHGGPQDQSLSQPSGTAPAPVPPAPQPSH